MSSQAKEDNNTDNIGMISENKEDDELQTTVLERNDNEGSMKNIKIDNAVSSETIMINELNDDNAEINVDEGIKSTELNNEITLPNKNIDEKEKENETNDILVNTHNEENENKQQTMSGKSNQVDKIIEANIQEANTNDLVIDEEETLGIDDTSEADKGSEIVLLGSIADDVENIATLESSNIKKIKEQNDDISNNTVESIRDIESVNTQTIDTIIYDQTEKDSESTVLEDNTTDVNKINMHESFTDKTSTIQDVDETIESNLKTKSTENDGTQLLPADNSETVEMEKESSNVELISNSVKTGNPQLAPIEKISEPDNDDDSQISGDIICSSDSDEFNDNIDESTEDDDSLHSQPKKSNHSKVSVVTDFTQDTDITNQSSNQSKKHIIQFEKKNEDIKKQKTKQSNKQNIIDQNNDEKKKWENLNKVTYTANNRDEYVFDSSYEIKKLEKFSDIGYAVSPQGYFRILSEFKGQSSVHIPYHVYTMESAVKELYNHEPLVEFSKYTCKFGDNNLEYKPLVIVFPIGLRCPAVKLRLPGCIIDQYSDFYNANVNMNNGSNITEESKSKIVAKKKFCHCTCNFFTIADNFFSGILESKDENSYHDQLLDASVICIVYPSSHKTKQRNQVNEKLLYHIAALATFRISPDGACIDFIRVNGYEHLYRKSIMKKVDTIPKNGRTSSGFSFHHCRLSCLLFSALQSMCSVQEFKDRIYMQIDFRYFAFQIFLTYGFRQSELHYNHQHYPLCMDNTNVYPKKLSQMHNIACNTYVSMSEENLSKLIQDFHVNSCNSKEMTPKQLSLLHDEICSNHEGCSRIIVLSKSINESFPPSRTFNNLLGSKQQLCNWVFAYSLPVPRCDYAPYSKYSADRLLTIFHPIKEKAKHGDMAVVTKAKYFPGCRVVRNEKIVLNEQSFKCDVEYMTQKFVQHTYQKPQIKVSLPAFGNINHYKYPTAELNTNEKQSLKELYRDKCSTLVMAWTENTEQDLDDKSTKTLSDTPSDLEKKFFPLELTREEMVDDSFYISLLSLFYGGNSFSNTTFHVLELKLSLIAVIRRIKGLSNVADFLNVNLPLTNITFTAENCCIILEAFENGILCSSDDNILQDFVSKLMNKVLENGINFQLGGPMVVISLTFMRATNECAEKLRKNSKGEWFSNQNLPVAMKFKPEFKDWEYSTMFFVSHCSQSSKDFRPFLFNVYSTQDNCQSKSPFKGLGTLVKKATIRSRDNEIFDYEKQEKRLVLKVPDDSEFAQMDENEDAIDCYDSDIDSDLNLYSNTVSVSSLSVPNDNDKINKDSLVIVKNPNAKCWNKISVDGENDDGHWYRTDNDNEDICQFSTSPFRNTNDNSIIKARNKIIDGYNMYKSMKESSKYKNVRYFPHALVDAYWRVRTIERRDCLVLDRLNFQSWFIQYICYAEIEEQDHTKSTVWIGFIPHYKEVKSGELITTQMKWLPFILPETYVERFFRESYRLQWRNKMNVICRIHPGKDYNQKKNTLVTNIHHEDINNVVFRYPIKYRQYNNFHCVFYSLLSALYYTEYSTECEKLLRLFRYKNTFSGVKPAHYTDICHIVASTINKGLSNCYLKRLKNRCRLKRQFKNIADKKRMYLLILCDRNGAANHAVTVANGHIFDSSNNFSMPFTLNNLVSCCDNDRLMDLDRLYEFQEKK